jgi:hypothetical protein
LATIANVAQSVRKPTRVAAFVISSESQTVDDITAHVGVPPNRSLNKGGVRDGSATRIPARFHSWELREEVASELPLQEAVDALFRRLLPLLEPLRRLLSAGCSYSVEIVQWISAEDPHGPGFGLGKDAIAFMAQISADLDIDQYVQ